MRIPLDRSALLFRLLVLAAACGLAPRLGAQAAPPAKKIVSSAEDLPRHTYKVTEAPSLIINDEAAFKDLAAQVRQDTAADLEQYDIKDRTALKDYKGILMNLAMLDKDYAAVERYIGELRALEEKPDLKLTTGLVSEAWAKAHLNATPDKFAGAFEAELAKSAAALPWALVGDDLKGIKSGYEIRSAALLIGTTQQEVDPAALKTGSISETVARRLVVYRNQLVSYLPYKAEIVKAISGVVTAHNIQKPDRWTERLVVLPSDAPASPVRVGIWDSGVDIDIYKAQLATDAQGHHGVAFDLHAYPSPDLLFPLGEAKANLPATIARVKGLLDLQSAIDSPEASDLKAYMSALKPDQVKPFLENLQMVENYAHGTHVAGIALAGDPFAQVVVGRITFGYTLVPETPTIEQAHRDAASYLAVVNYFKTMGVRVVNMSWGGSLRSVESDLEENGAGGNAEERKKLARQIFDIGADGLRAALAGAPNILFVVAAGNGDNDVKFDEFIPSSFQLPNMITVGAVDQAGEETSFSSFGPTVNVHANGFEVESYIPGGKRLKFSGTSMASPQVTNLAAKLFALDPRLTPEAAKALILAGCDRSGRVNLLSPVKSIALLKRQLAAAK